MCEHISITLPNRPGEMMEVSRILASGNINILGFSLSSEGRSGILYLLCSEHDRAFKVLSSRYSFYCSERKVLVVETENSPGKMNEILTCLNALKINLDVAYQATRRDSEILLILEFDDESYIKPAEGILIEKGFSVLSKI